MIKSRSFPPSLPTAVCGFVTSDFLRSLLLSPPLLIHHQRTLLEAYVDCLGRGHLTRGSGCISSNFLTSVGRSFRSRDQTMRDNRKALYCHYRHLPSKCPKLVPLGTCKAHPTLGPHLRAAQHVWPNQEDELAGHTDPRVSETRASPRNGREPFCNSGAPSHTETLIGNQWVFTEKISRNKNVMDIQGCLPGTVAGGDEIN